MLKAILFDFDGVLTIDKTGSESITKYLAKESKIPLDRIQKSYYRYNRALLYGETTHEEIWPSFCKDLGKELDIKILNAAYEATKLDSEMIKYVKQLKEIYKIGMITDNKCDRINAILSYHQLQSYFDVVSISAQYHSDKKEKEIFVGTMQNLQVAAEECIFIDNSEQNLIVPQRLGMQTILFDPDHRDIAQLKNRIEAMQ